MDYGRIRLEKPNRYHPTRVLEGNWFEDRRRFIKTLYNYNTTYNIFHAPKPYSAPDSSVVWDAIFQGEGYGRETLFDHNGQDYIDNYSTTYDLSYRHFPKFFCRPPLLEPKCGYNDEIDLTLNYGPITNRGLRELKQVLWRHQKGDPRSTNRTTYEDTFEKPDRKSYPLIFSEKCNCVPGHTGWNPITWDCNEPCTKMKHN